MRQLQTIIILSIAALVSLAVTRSSNAANFRTGTFALKGPDGATWAITFGGKGKFTLTRAGAQAVQGTYQAAKDQITFTDQKGPLAETGDAETGTYTWKLDGNKLTSTKVKDVGKGRPVVLTFVA